MAETSTGFIAVATGLLAEARIAHLAHHDALTDLPNRVLLRDRLADALVRVRHGDTLAVHCIDLDCFKEANDELGHPVGDALLKAVAGRLRACVGQSDTVARIGGDSFADAEHRYADTEGYH